jgi:hypothetical protein
LRERSKEIENDPTQRQTKKHQMTALKSLLTLFSLPSPNKARETSSSSKCVEKRVTLAW